jgi:hypothetical protein
MEEKKEEDFEQEWDEDKLDPTKEAFFADMLDMEEEIASEAYELVDHAINLIKSQYYDDGIEILRQAIGLYTQINKEEEIKAINEKIAEVYILKEKTFREIEIESENEVEVYEEAEHFKEKAIIEETKNKAEMISKADQLIVEAHQLVNTNKFEEALDRYDEAEQIFQDFSKTNEIERLYTLIEECYNKKAEYLRIVKKEEVEEIDVPLSEEQIKEKKLKFFLDAKKREEEKSSKAYELLDQAVEMAKRKDYSQAIKLYGEGAKLFEDLNWTYEAKRIHDTIKQLEKEKISYFKEIKTQKKITEQKISVEAQREVRIDKQIQEVSEQEKIAQLEKLRGIELQKMEQEFFKVQIDNMATEAARMAREYEISLQKSIKEGKTLEECIYPKVIEIYKRIKELLIDKGWNNEAAIYDDTIDFYLQKSEKDKKIRQIETDKIKRKEESDARLKMKEIKADFGLSEEQQRIMEKQHQKEIEIQKIRNKIDEMTKRVERLGREYEVGLRQGKFELKCPYPEIIDILEKTRQMALERDWETDVSIISSQIYNYKVKLKKDNRLRQIEADKIRKQEEIKELHKVPKRGPIVGLDAEKLKSFEEQRKIEKEKEDFDSIIDVMIKRAETMAKDYETAMKKAIKEGKLAENPPFLKIIGIFERVKRLLFNKGRTEEAAAYSNQINYYTQKLEQDNKLREVEVKKARRERALEEMHKIGKEIGIDKKRLKAIEKKKEEEDFEKYISDSVNSAEKMVRDYEIAKRKAYRKGEILESTPYPEVIEIYKQIREKVSVRGWKEQAEVFANQVKIYQEKLKKHEHLLEVEAKKVQREKALEDMRKVDKLVEVDKEKLSVIQKKKDEKEFQKYITDTVNKAEKLEREFDSVMKKAIKRGEVIKQTPYPEIIEIYNETRALLVEKGWIEQSQIYTNQIKIYQEKLKKHEHLLEVEEKKAQRERELEQLKKLGKREVIPVKPEKVKELGAGEKEEDILLEKAMNLIDKAEKAVKSYELSIRKDILVYVSPYDRAITNYENAREIFKKIGWNDEANRLVNTIKFYKEKKEKDEKLRIIEQKKFEKPEIELISAEIEPDKKFFERQKRLVEIVQKEKELDEAAAGIFNMIQSAERMAQEYELKLKGGIFDFESPYEKIIEIYREARKNFEEIDWKEESAKLIDTINYYKEKLAKDKKIRAIEAEKVKKREEELIAQQKLLEQARLKQEKLIQQRKESIDLKRERVVQFETQKDKAFRLMDQAKRELRQNNFEKAIEFYEESESIFTDIEWEEGIKMVRDSVRMIKNKKKAFELEQQTIEERKVEALKIEEKLEEKLAEAQLIRKKYQEEKRKEVLRIQREKEKERQISEDAYKLLEEGTSLMDSGKFMEAYDKYIAARELFQKISWHREVSRINNELLLKLKMEKKQAEILEDIKMKKIEEEKERILLKEEARRERKELEKRKKDEKRRLAREELDRKISIKLDKANKLIDNFKYNEGVLILKEEIQRLTKLERHDEIERITEQIKNIKAEADIPLIILDVPLNELQNVNFKSAYEALDKAQVSMVNNKFKKAISELNEAKFKIKSLKIGEKFQKELDGIITKLKGIISKKPIEELVKAKTKTKKDDRELVRERIAARREERRKKVLDLLKKNIE